MQAPGYRWWGFSDETVTGADARHLSSPPAMSILVPSQ
jgi:hypothetical protein